MPQTAAPTDTATQASRRDVLQAGAFAAAVATLGAGAAMANVPKSRPHILYILADDLGFADLGHRGSNIATPNIDALAAGGVRLREFYTQPLCTPTRAALMTGRYPMRYGLQMGVIPSGASYGLDPAEQTLPALLKSAGYRTSLVGKWHLGHADEKFWPRQRGFDSFYGALIGEIDHFQHSSHGVKDWFRDNRPIDEQGYDTELFGAEAIRQIGAHDRTVPLFLYLAFTAPHTPLQAPQAWLDRYAHIKDENRRAYAAMVSAMDHQVGLVLQALKVRGMLEDTLVVFHSDNGGTRDKMFVGEGEVGGDLPASNGILREGKGTVYEGGVRVDAIVSWAGRLKPADVTGPFHVVDICAPHPDHPQYRPHDRLHPRGRLEAGLDRPVAAQDRAVQPEDRPIRKDQCRRPAPRDREAPAGQGDQARGRNGTAPLCRERPCRCPVAAAQLPGPSGPDPQGALMARRPCYPPGKAITRSITQKLATPPIA
jgi:hypothetical protein